MAISLKMVTVSTIRLRSRMPERSARKPRAYDPKHRADEQDHERVPRQLAARWQPSEARHDQLGVGLAFGRGRIGGSQE